MDVPPNTIYLQVDDDREDVEVTWCKDKIYESDVMYIRADKVVEYIVKLEKQLADLQYECNETIQQIADGEF